MEIMTAAHPRWEEFLAQLDRNLPDQQNSCGHNFARTMEALADMGDFDPFSTVEYLQECGAYCDCEVFFNVLSAANECNAWRRANFKVIRGRSITKSTPPRPPASLSALPGS